MPVLWVIRRLIIITKSFVQFTILGPPICLAMDVV